MSSTGGYVKQLSNNNAGDLFPTVTSGANAVTYYCDYHYDNKRTGDRAVFIGGRADASAGCGWFYVDSSHGVGNADVNIGCRLIYLG